MFWHGASLMRASRAWGIPGEPGGVGRNGRTPAVPRHRATAGVRYSCSYRVWMTTLPERSGCGSAASMSPEAPGALS